MNKNSLTIMVLIALVVGAAAFYGGMTYQKSQKSQVTGNQTASGRFQGRSGGIGANGGARPVAGEILSSDDKSITVKLQDGSSKIVLISDKTSINKAEQTTKDDLKTGVTVAAFGTQNSDGSVSAQNIQINPMFRGSLNPGQNGGK